MMKHPISLLYETRNYYQHMADIEENKKIQEHYIKQAKELNKIIHYEEKRNKAIRRGNGGQGI
jgi:predicted Rossmann-fold nucleotide-binding protein